MLLHALMLSLFLATTTSDIVRSENCALNALGQDVEMSVSECTREQERCPLFKGTNHTVVISFTPSRRIRNNMTFKVYGVFLMGQNRTMKIPHGRPSNACSNSVLHNSTDNCTSMGQGFVKGQKYLHNSIFFVSPRYPEKQLTVKFLISSKGNREVAVCQDVKVEIRNRERVTAP